MSQQARPVRLHKVAAQSRVVSLLPAILLIGGLLRLAIAWRDLDVLDTLFFPDDTYLSLNIARNLALGFGSTFDREILTNGYQPLYVWLMVPVYWLFPADLVLPVHLALTMLALVGVATGWFVYRIVRRLGQPSHALVACAIWMLDPVVFTHSMNGLETGLALLGIAATTDWYLARVRSPIDVQLRDVLILGLLAGLTILARVDQALLLAALGLDLLLLRPRWRTVGRLALVGCVALLVTMPWIVFSWSIGLGPVPESGAAVRFLGQAHVQTFGPHLPGGWYAWTLLQSLGMLLVAPYTTPVFLWGALFITLVRRLRKQPNHWVRHWLRRIRPLRFAALYCTILFLAYWLFIPAVWFFERYWQPIALFALITTVLMLPNLDDPRLRQRRLFQRAILAVVLVEAVLVLRFLVVWPAPNGYRSIALWIDRNLAGQTVGAFQSGAVGYWAQRTRVVNLDGVVDRTSLAARREGRTMDQLRRRQVDWVIDWTEAPGLPVDGDLGAVELQYKIPGVQSWDLPWHLFKVQR